jgi:hypothetical protein
MNKIAIGTSRYSSGMGDILLLTSICKHIKNVTVELYPHAEKYKIFFDNICEKVVISDNAFVTKDSPPGHFSQQKLRSLGFENVCYLPYIYPKSEYLEKGLSLIKNYKNPIAFVANCAKHSQNREPSKEYLQKIINEYSKKYTVLQFGLSNNFTEFNNTIPIKDVSLYDLICYYIAIKNFIGVDTGDSHLMIALGGKCDILIPSDQSIRNQEWWDYKGYTNINYYSFN